MISGRLAIILLLTLNLFHSCAEERSEEDREREDVEREVQRLKLAETNFIGAVEKDSGFIPVRMKTTTLRNPNGESDVPVVETELTLGLFGGVTFRTTQTSYDFGTGKLVARFADRAGAPDSDDRSIEWRSVIKDGKVESASIFTSVGTFDLTPDQSFANSFPQDTDHTYTFLVYSNEKKHDFLAKLSIENLAEDEAAPPGYSVPRIPKLRAGLRFSGTGIVPQNADKTVYDPFRGTIEMFYPGNARIVIDQLTLSAAGLSLADDLSKRNLTGSLFKGAEFQRKVTFATTSDQNLLAATSLSLPPEKYTGTYRASQDTLEWTVAVKLEYVGDIGINNDNMTFRQFPMLQLTVYRCWDDSRWLSRKYYSLRSIDYIRSQARFTINNSSSSGDSDLVLTYSNGWKTLTGSYIDGEGSGSEKDSWEFNIAADSAGFDKSCTL